jgi:hypothetical protein
VQMKLQLGKKRQKKHEPLFCLQSLRVSSLDNFIKWSRQLQNIRRSDGDDVREYFSTMRRMKN